ncbi:MAG TPA: helicase C-terminal domain-containing protein, partial [Thermoanaerobaculia bacterium]|nr:helicase C-terminal domain-containing protein [Thermoanaerobaculia bacterium]
VMPVSQNAKPRLLIGLLKRGEIETALVFTRTKHRANRLAEKLEKAGVAVARIHGNRSQSQREMALADFKSGKLAVLVATDIASRGIDIEALPHVLNFDVPGQPEDYIHRVGRTARARLTGHAVTFAAPEESGELAAIERAVGKRLPRRRLEDFDYEAAPAERFEIPVGERIAAIRARKAEDRARSRAKAERRTTGQPGSGSGRPAAARDPQHRGPGGAPAGRRGAERGGVAARDDNRGNVAHGGEARGQGSRGGDDRGNVARIGRPEGDDARGNVAGHDEARGGNGLPATWGTVPAARRAPGGGPRRAGGPAAGRSRADGRRGPGGRSGPRRDR